MDAGLRSLLYTSYETTDEFETQRRILEELSRLGFQGDIPTSNSTFRSAIVAIKHHKNNALTMPSNLIAAGIYRKTESLRSKLSKLSKLGFQISGGELYRLPA